MAALKFLPSADASVVSEHSRNVIRAILIDAELPSCVITSTVRTPAGQARAMYNNIEKAGVDEQLRLYAAPGRQVIAEYQRLKPTGVGRQTIIDAMEQRILAIGPGKVSKHCADPSRLNVVDIAPSSIASQRRFLNALERAVQAGRLSKYLAPAHGDPAFHLEIEQ